MTRFPANSRQDSEQSNPKQNVPEPAENRPEIHPLTISLDLLRTRQDVIKVLESSSSWLPWKGTSEADRFSEELLTFLKSDKGRACYEAVGAAAFATLTVVILKARAVGDPVGVPLCFFKNLQTGECTQAGLEQWIETLAMLEMKLDQKLQKKGAKYTTWSQAASGCAGVCAAAAVCSSAANACQASYAAGCLAEHAKTVLSKAMLSKCPETIEAAQKMLAAATAMSTSIVSPSYLIGAGVLAAICAVGWKYWDERASLLSKLRDQLEELIKEFRRLCLPESERQRIQQQLDNEQSAATSAPSPLWQSLSSFSPYNWSFWPRVTV
eukprot:m.3369 g.3369  ORF g.3369 m.3369 type:complete len:325 (+) comp5173_c0_seq1:114-1088(+)